MPTLVDGAKDRPTGELNGLALCAGIGGLELGIHLAIGNRYRTVCYVEREAFAASTLVARMEDEVLDQAPIWDDIKTFSGEPWRGSVDIISAGYPCQPFSIAGRQGGVADERHLWPHIARIARECEPEWIFLENVPHHLRLGFDTVVIELREMGYGVAAGIFSAEEVGASHRRERLFALAYRERGGDERRRIAGVLGSTENVQPRELRQRKRDGDTVDDRGEALGEPERPRWETAGQRGGKFAGSKSEAGCGTLALSEGQQVWLTGLAWPPPPDDAEGWEGVVPALEPAIRGVADGAANRMDRLRCLGNGVVPLVAAHAFRTLAIAVRDEA